MDLPVLQKRPFCNAFTGCGRKRSNLRGSDASDLFGSRQSGSQNKLYALLQQKMAEVEALRGILDEHQELRPLHSHGNTIVWTNNICSGMLQHSVQEAGKKTPIKHSTEHNSLEMNGIGSPAKG
ncbi:hypothetical protein AVEN_197459-1 [Araneus ventricosus]|uniref:Cardioactive peptide n=1 Tax=Araneus ventricosus TaxID=182803 RepID=A0A4Y2QWN3_ARAVE|nr:hypothetical protein AVEN_197459-1 [Araneus ventricosus]